MSSDINQSCSVELSIDRLCLNLDKLPTHNKGTSSQNKNVQIFAQNVINIFSSVDFDTSSFSDAWSRKIVKKIRKTTARFDAINNGGGFKRLGDQCGKIFASDTKKISHSAIAMMKNYSDFLEGEIHRREIDHSKKKRLLECLSNHENFENSNALKRLVRDGQSNGLFKDRDFFFHCMIWLVKKSPNYFSRHLREFPFSNKQEAVEIGAFLENQNQRKTFRLFFGIERIMLDFATTYIIENNEWDLHLQLGTGGDYFGHTLCQLDRMKMQTLYSRIDNCPAVKDLRDQARNTSIEGRTGNWTTRFTRNPPRGTGMGFRACCDISNRTIYINIGLPNLTNNDIFCSAIFELTNALYGARLGLVKKFLKI